MLLIIFPLMLSISGFVIANDLFEKNYVQNSQLINEITFSGPMGMGLSRSYELKNEKFCFYNTINGQKKIMLENVNAKCPKKIPIKKQ